MAICESILKLRSDRGVPSGGSGSSAISGSIGLLFGVWHRKTAKLVKGWRDATQRHKTLTSI
jgi:hypothetical protein